MNIPPIFFWPTKNIAHPQTRIISWASVLLSWAGWNSQTNRAMFY